MSQTEFLDRINGLSLQERLNLLETAMQQVKEEVAQLKRKRPLLFLSEEEISQQLRKQAEEALPYYLNDKELTIFTALDGEDFYEYEDYKEE